MLVHSHASSGNVQQNYGLLLRVRYFPDFDQTRNLNKVFLNDTWTADWHSVLRHFNLLELFDLLNNKNSMKALWSQLIKMLQQMLYLKPES